MEQRASISCRREDYDENSFPTFTQPTAIGDFSLTDDGFIDRVGICIKLALLILIAINLESRSLILK